MSVGHRVEGVIPAYRNQRQTEGVPRDLFFVGRAYSPFHRVIVKIKVFQKQDRCRHVIENFCPDAHRLGVNFFRFIEYTKCHMTSIPLLGGGPASGRLFNKVN